jgi:alpha-glucosidase
VYVREGAIVPLQPVVQSTDEALHGPLTLQVYPGKDCRGALYVDDGKTFAYKRGEFLRTDFTCQETSQGITLHVGQRQGSFQPWWDHIHIEIYGWDHGSASVSVGNKSINLVPAVDANRHVVSIDVPAEAAGGDFEIHGTQ